MSNDKERHMVIAHRHGCERAREAFAAAVKLAELLYPGKEHAQFSYVAGFAAEVRRIAARTQNKGFRQPSKLEAVSQ